MNKTFKDDPVFQGGLQPLLKDRAVQTMERANLDPLRDGAVFHFLPERFAETLQKATCNECPFIEAEETKIKACTILLPT
jgi:hypothetical protein